MWRRSRVPASVKLTGRVPRFTSDAPDVAAAVRFARAEDLQVAPQRTGHNAAPLRDLDEVLLLKTTALQGVAIDASAHRARVSAGAKWADVVPHASELGSSS